MESTHASDLPVPDEPPATKRPYVEPRIDELGTVEQLTAHGGLHRPSGAPDRRAFL
ncbi:hypothetical protein [Streptomyces sp. URMC 124]|uniref:hypothetical protein n=1 Tax=Streptomyces sp. URMC 124 TaxID=3423405 RepID=UPI003F1A9337